MKPFPIILSSPSGGGKTTIARRILAARTDTGYSVSCTTRSPREGERDGHDYHFLTETAFAEARGRGDFAESAEVHGFHYGTLRSEVERVLESGRHVVMDIDVQGARQFFAAFPQSVLIFILPPTAEILVDRLKARGTEGSQSLARRLESARNELRAAGEYRYVIVNDDLERAVAAVSSVIDAEGVTLRRIDDLGPRLDLLVKGIESAMPINSKR